MCDYSIKVEKTMEAEKDLRLVSTRFRGGTIGFAPLCGDSDTAVCLRPGTEIAFAQPVRDASWHPDCGWARVDYGTTAVFAQRDVDRDFTHHDYLEFPNGTSLPLAALGESQEARVLQMPVDPNAKRAFTVNPKTDTRIEADKVV